MIYLPCMAVDGSRILVLEMFGGQGSAGEPILFKPLIRSTVSFSASMPNEHSLGCVLERFHFRSEERRVGKSVGYSVTVGVCRGSI